MTTSLINVCIVMDWPHLSGARPRDKTLEPRGVNDVCHGPADTTGGPLSRRTFSLLACRKLPCSIDKEARRYHSLRNRPPTGPAHCAAKVKLALPTF